MLRFVLPPDCCEVTMYATVRAKGQLNPEFMIIRNKVQILHSIMIFKNVKNAFHELIDYETVLKSNYGSVIFLLAVD